MKNKALSVLGSVIISLLLVLQPANVKAASSIPGTAVVSLYWASPNSQAVEVNLFGDVRHLSVHFDAKYQPICASNLTSQITSQITVARSGDQSLEVNSNLSYSFEFIPNYDEFGRCSDGSYAPNIEIETVFYYSISADLGGYFQEMNFPLPTIKVQN